MKSRKETGSFYTPKIVAEFLVDYLSEKLNNCRELSILEPSAGDGAFIREIYAHETLSSKITLLTAVEQDGNELGKIESSIKHDTLQTVHADFLDFQNDNEEQYSLIIGNPPYVKRNLLDENQAALCSSIHESAKLANRKPNNIWTAFLVRCIDFTNSDGVLAFILPAEFLQVKFAAELRELILQEFERVEIFTFNELLFPDCRGQDTLLLIAERKSSTKGVFYCNIEKVADLSARKFTLAQNVKIKDSKWTHHHLETDEIELLEKLKQQLNVVNHYCSSKAGIVTGATDFFVVDKATINEYSLQEFIRPIIQKGLFINGSVELTTSEFQKLVDGEKPTYLLAINKDSCIKNNAKVRRYLEFGETRKIHERYKTSLRDNWYEVPNVGNPTEALFFKRCSKYPKLIKNSAGVLATDTAYLISMNSSFAIENLIFSFYNSLTLAFAELSGRYYGGGVLELTPNEFKQLPIPYHVANDLDFATYSSGFREKRSIGEVCAQYDKIILKAAIPGLDDDSIEKLAIIRKKLFLRRIKSE